MANCRTYFNFLACSYTNITLATNKEPIIFVIPLKNIENSKFYKETKI